ncbi:MAG: ABC transporter substrate-binding protein [Chloroflexia bacterium]|nr:ABC transporter substrate-binding protein [Chloroflexia bacterium]
MRSWSVRVLAALLVAPMVLAAVSTHVSGLQGVAAQAQAGGTLRVAQAQSPDTLDTDKSASRYNEYITRQIFDSLIAVDAEGTFHPWLATSWEQSADGLTWTLTLREGVTFHDGTPFNAEAVKFNFDRIKDPNTRSVTTAGYWGPYESTTVVDEFTVEVAYTEVYAPFLAIISNELFGMKSPAAVAQYGDDFGRNPVGSGPFTFVEWIEGDHVTLRQNPEYNWPPANATHQGPAYLDEIIYTFPEEPSTRTALLEAGEVDVITHVNFIDVEAVEAADDLRVHTSIIQASAAGMLLNTERFPTDDVEVRKALQYATNQEEISQLVTFGVEIPNKGVLTPESWIYYAPEAELYSYDPARANEILETAGWVDTDDDGVREKDGQRLQMSYICFPGAGCSQAEVIQAQWSDVGVELELLQLANPANKEASTRGDHNVRPLSWNHADPMVLSVMFHPDNVDEGWAFSRWRAPELAEMLNNATTIQDQNERIAAYKAIQTYIMENSLFIPTVATTFVVGLNEKVQEFATDSTGYTMVLYDTWIAE